LGDIKYPDKLNNQKYNGFGKITINGKADGLPAGVNPSDVKMMFGSYRTLAIVTCNGDAWVLSFNGSKTVMVQQKVLQTMSFGIV
jgi:hypothetical protein